MSERAATAAPAAQAQPPSMALQRKCACGTHTSGGETCSDCRRKQEALQRKAASGRGAPEIPSSVHRTLASPGRALDGATRGFMEPRLGHDFSHVRVHADAEAAASARAVGALAYTVGPNIVFDHGRYDPASAHGRRLLAHELVHVVQQGRGAVRADRIDAPDSPLEREADRIADGIEGAEPATVERTAATGVLSRQAAPVLVEPPPVEPFVLPEGEAANDNAVEPLVPGSSAPRYAPSPYDQSLEAAMARARIRDYAERQRQEQERPVAVLDRGGAAPGFVTEHGTRRYDWMGGPGGGGSINVRVRRFHVLDAIEYELSTVTTPEQVQEVAQRYLPYTAILEEAVALSQGERRRQPLLVPMVRPLGDVPVFPQNFDPQAATRLATFTAAVGRRASVVPAVARSRYMPRQRQSGRCQLEPIEAMGNDPLSSLYCHAVTGSPLSYRITVPGAGGGLTQRWAEIDALRGNTWFECKCGYEGLLLRSRPGVANSVLESLDHQVLNHVHIANACGLEYRYIVSSDRVAELLRSRWFGNVTVDVRHFESCD